LGLYLASLCWLPGCGGSSNMVAPIVLSVSVSESPITVIQGGGPVYVAVTIMAPTETASFTMTGLPAGVNASYKESESNPSGQLTLTASSIAPLGTTMPVITVGSSGQTASTTVKLVVAAPAKTAATKPGR
jgi:hypothetical protein